VNKSEGFKDQEGKGEEEEKDEMKYLILMQERMDEDRG